MKIISFKTCPFVQRATLVLEAKNLDYEIEYIELEKKPEWFLNLSPHGQVPILIADNKAVLFESEAIAEYLEELYPHKLHSEDPTQRAQDRAWAVLGPKSYPLLSKLKQAKDEKAFEEGKALLIKQLRKIEPLLQDVYFRNKLGWVDLAWIPLLYRIFLIEKEAGIDILKNLPKVKAWQLELVNLDLVKKSIAPDFKNCFYKRYITPTNYLGHCKQSNMSHS